MDIDFGIAQVGVPEQAHHSVEVGSRLHQVSSETVAQRVGMNRLSDAGAQRGETAGMPYRLVAHGLAGKPLLIAGEEPGAGLVRKRTPPDAQLRQQRLAEWNIAILASLALPDVDHHAGGVDVLNLQAADFGAANPGGV